MEGMLLRDIVHLENILDGISEPTGLKLSLLEYMTDDFSDKRVVGRGGFGVVYKGEFKNRNVAVKKLTFTNNAEKDFDREVHNLMRVSHENIVRFLGYCHNTKVTFVNEANKGEPERFTRLYNQETIICFEYVSNGSLSNHIHDELRGLEWQTRYNIIKGICQALDYLHNIKKLVHRDLKPDNILIDNLMAPKIADLGISKLLNDGASKSMTTNIKATWDYAAPEFADRVVSFKYDIYSLGIIIIELVTGFREEPDLKTVLTRWRHRWNKSNETLRYQQVAKCIEIGLSCKNRRPKKRPSITKIIKDLEDVDGCNGELRQEIPCWNELLWVEPAELFFPFQINKQMACLLELHNNTDAYMAFFVKTDSDMQYDMDPKKGIIQPRSHLSVSITLLAQEEAPEKVWNADEFTVKSKKANKDLTAEEITKEFFSKKSGDTVDKVRIGVVFDAQRRAACMVDGEPKEHLSLDPLEISGSQESGETSIEAEPITQSVYDLDTEVIDFPSMEDTKQYTSSGSAHLQVIDEEPTIVPPNSDDSSLQPGITHVEVNDEDPASPILDGSSSQSAGSTQDEASDEEPPDSDDSALRSGAAHGQANDEEPPISDDSCNHVDDDEEEPPKNPGVEPGSVELVIKYGETVPWKGALKQRLLLEFTGSDYTSARPGLDLVAVLDVSGEISDDWMKEVKTAMRFVLRKLGPIDRLSIVTFSGDGDATELCPLRQITEASRLELEEVIEGLKDSGDDSVDVNVGLLAGLKVLADRRVTGGRVAAIMLVARGEARCSKDGAAAAEVSFRDVPVHTFGFRGSSYPDYTPLIEVSANSKGGTFSYVEVWDRYSGGLTMALSQCLAGLLTAAVWDLKLTVEAVQEGSTLLLVATRMREYINKSGRPTIWFGNVYCREVRRVVVDITLPLPAASAHDDSSSSSGEILNVTYSYFTRHVCSCCSALADGPRVTRGCRAESTQTVDEDAAKYKMEEDRTRTPHMDMYREQAKNFYNDLAMSLPSADDDDVKEELGHLTIDVATREAEIKRLRLDCMQD